MAQNKGAIVRYHAIDRCLRKKNGRYGWEELAKACNEALYDAFSEHFSISRRQIFLDLNHMESNAGYRAIIKRTKEGKRTYYSYEDPNFSIEKTPITEGEVEQLKETILMLNRFKGMPHFEWMEELLSKLEDTFHLKGFGDYYKPSDGLFDAVANKQVLILSPWPYDPKKRGITRAECVAMNQMAEEICSLSSIAPTDSREKY